MSELVGRWVRGCRRLHAQHGRVLTLTLKHLLSAALPGASQLLDALEELVTEATREAPDEGAVARYLRAQGEEGGRALVEVLEQLSSPELRGLLVRVRSLAQSGATEEVLQGALARQAERDGAVRGALERVSSLERGQGELLEIALRQEGRVLLMEQEVRALREALREVLEALCGLSLEGRGRLALRREALRALLAGEKERLRGLAQGAEQEVLPLLEAGRCLCVPVELRAFHVALHGEPPPPPPAPALAPAPAPASQATAAPVAVQGARGGGEPPRQNQTVSYVPVGEGSSRVGAARVMAGWSLRCRIARRGSSGWALRMGWVMIVSARAIA